MAPAVRPSSSELIGSTSQQKGYHVGLSLLPRGQKDHDRHHQSGREREDRKCPDPDDGAVQDDRGDGPHCRTRRNTDSAKICQRIAKDAVQRSTGDG